MELSRDSKQALSLYNSLQGYYSDITNSTIFPQDRSSLDFVRDQLTKRLRGDHLYSEGKVIGAMSTSPHPFAKELYARYMDRNLGDRGLNPETCTIEQEVIQMLSNLLHGRNLIGNLTSGGTESNLIAIFLAKSNRPEVTHPNIVVPASAHYSFMKAALLMGLELRKAPVVSNYQVDVDSVSNLVDSNTIAIVGVAGTSALGVVDPIPELAQIALEHNIHFHVDGAFGGLVLPYLENLGHYVGPIYDFRIKGIDSFTVDPHKMGWNVNPSGGILLNPARWEWNGFKIPYLAGGGIQSFNLLGTRPGAAAISYWGLLHALGFKGFSDIIESCWDLTQYAYKRTQELFNIDAVQDPTMNVLGIRPSAKSKWSLETLNEQCRQNGYALGKFLHEQSLRIVLMPHVSVAHIEDFFTFLETLSY